MPPLQDPFARHKNACMQLGSGDQRSSGLEKTFPSGTSHMRGAREPSCRIEYFDPLLAALQMPWPPRALVESFRWMAGDIGNGRPTVPGVTHYAGKSGRRPVGVHAASAPSRMLRRGDEREECLAKSKPTNDQFPNSKAPLPTPWLMAPAPRMCDPPSPRIASPAA